MNYDLTRLRNGIDKNVVIDDYYSFTEDELKGTDLSKLDNVHIEGEISLNAIDEIYLSLQVTGNMVIPCAITLKPVDVPFDIIIEGDLSEIHPESQENVEKCINSLDILPIIWENILMEIPMRVVSPDADITKLKGDGWRVITDEEDSVNSELSKLKDLLDDSEVR
jgi:uncharacterized protein